jgi:brefeldin A-inhibited guanine nucleotide-exchange protein 3
METDSDEKQLLNQILNAVKVTPSLNEDLQVEVMKVGLMWSPMCIIGTGNALLPALVILERMPLRCSHCSFRIGDHCPCSQSSKITLIV